MIDLYADMLRDEPIDALQARYRYLASTIGDQTGADYRQVAYWLGLVRVEIERRERCPDPVDALYQRLGSFDVARIKQDIRIADVVAALGGVELRRQGSRFVSHCPLHAHRGDDSTPSLTVYPDTNSFYCYGCGQGGDVIRFAQLLIPRWSFHETCTALLECMGKRPASYRQGFTAQSPQGRVRVA